MSNFDWNMLYHLFWILPALMIFDILQTRWGFKRSESWINKRYRIFRRIVWREQFILELPRFAINQTMNIMLILGLAQDTARIEWAVIRIIAAIFMFFFEFYTFDLETRKRIKRSDAKVALKGKNLNSLSKEELQIFLDIQEIPYGAKAKQKRIKRDGRIERERIKLEAAQKRAIEKAKHEKTEVDNSVSKEELIKLVKESLKTPGA